MRAGGKADREVHTRSCHSRVASRACLAGSKGAFNRVDSELIFCKKKLWKVSVAGKCHFFISRLKAGDSGYGQKLDRKQCRYAARHNGSFSRHYASPTDSAFAVSACDKAGMVVSYSKCCIAKEKEIWTLQVVLLTPTCTIQKRFAIHTQLHYRQPHCECRPLHYRKHAQIVTVYYDRSDVTQVS